METNLIQTLMLYIKCIHFDSVIPKFYLKYLVVPSHIHTYDDYTYMYVLYLISFFLIVSFFCRVDRMNQSQYEIKLLLN